MSATVARLPLIDELSATLFPDPVLPHVVAVESHAPALKPAPETGRDDVFALNVTGGCYHRCAFCAVRASSSYAGDNVLANYLNSAARLTADLAGRGRLPRAVFIGPDMDPFPPHCDIQAVTASVVETL